MKYECHFPNQHQKLYQKNKAQPNTFFFRHPILHYRHLSLSMGVHVEVGMFEEAAVRPIVTTLG